MLAKFALRNMGRNGRRSIVVISTMAMGVFGLLFLQGFFSGLLAMHAQNSIHSRHGHGQVMTKGYFERSFEKPSDHWIDATSAVQSFLHSHPAVAETFPRVQFFALLNNGQVNIAGKGMGVDGAKEEKFFNRMNFVEGGPIGEDADGIVLGVGLARSLNAKVGDRITVLGQTLRGTLNAVDTTVSGIFHVGMKEADDVLFQVQIANAHLLLDTDRIEAIAIGLKEGATFEQLAKDIEGEFPGLDALSVYEIDHAWAENGRLFLLALLNLFRVTFLGVILLAIYNSASNTVLERKRELGMLRAGGESISDIVKLLTLEGMGLAVIGAVVGVALVYMATAFVPEGILMPPTPGTNRALKIQIDLQLIYLVTATGLAVGASVMATFMSALQVAKLSIVKALRAPL